ncbi:MAG TPA: CUAEP/CCAEP-tail radical SAM protein [Vicinamibacterales bacterium]|jgi:radical SAM superfamily enzyme YgiQ (UPF0313 family)|nr:CUAEP/CCAEP-tail radical SAM protein [Vicinamibacterales bacterium]
MRALLISTYEMGRQPFGLASPAAWLGAAGWEVACADVAKERLDADIVQAADLIAFHLPMHTATRLAMPVIEKIRRLNPRARLCAYGLYAPLNGDALRALGVEHVLGGEFEEDLAGVANDLSATSAGAPQSDRTPRSSVRSRGARGSAAVLPRIHFLVPDRSGLPPLSRYATLQMPDGHRRLVGYTEASRGCRHLCRHCPIVPAYNGQFRVVQPDVVLADVEAQIAAGAEHITFGDPDFFNGPTHAMRIVETLHASHPTVTYDVTIKVEHLLRQRALLPRLRDSGCAFVTTAIESVDDRVLALLEKGHTRRDFVDAVALCRGAGLTLIPTFVAFHPWLTLEGYCDLLDTIAGLELVDHVAPIQLAIRLLIPHGSRLLELDEVRRLVQGFDPKTLTHRWTHPDPRVDRLQEDIVSLVGVRLASDRRARFEEISAVAHERAGVRREATRPVRDRATVPYLNEPWYC